MPCIGPIVKNKTFFLLNYEGTRIERGETDFRLVPDPEELQGRFSETVIDPWTGQPFPDNIIPRERWSGGAWIRFHLLTNGLLVTPEVLDRTVAAIQRALASLPAD